MKNHIEKQFKGIVFLQELKARMHAFLTYLLTDREGRECEEEQHNALHQEEGDGLHPADLRPCTGRPVTVYKDSIGNCVPVSGRNRYLCTKTEQVTVYQDGTGNRVPGRNR